MQQKFVKNLWTFRDKIIKSMSVVVFTQNPNHFIILPPLGPQGSHILLPLWTQQWQKQYITLKTNKLHLHGWTVTTDTNPDEYTSLSLSELTRRVKPVSSSLCRWDVQKFTQRMWTPESNATHSNRPHTQRKFPLFRTRPAPQSPARAQRTKCRRSRTHRTRESVA